MAVGHYTLNARGAIETAPPATPAACIPYLVVEDGAPVLCVIEGGAFHRFAVSDAGVGRLGSNCAELLWRRVTTCADSAELRGRGIGNGGGQ